MPDREQDIERIAADIADVDFGDSGHDGWINPPEKIAAALYDAGLRPLATEGDAAPGGTVKVFDTADEFIAHLDRLAARLKES